MSSTALIRELQVLAGARRPQWERQPTLTDIPYGSGVGVSLTPGGSAAMFALVSVKVREVPSRRSARISVADLDPSATYTLVLGGVTVDYDAAAAGASSELDVLVGLGSAIESTPGAEALVSHEVDHEAEELRIWGKDSADYTIDESTTAGELSVVADAVSAKLALWGWAAGDGDVPPDWDRIPGTDIDLTIGNFLERYDVRGLARLAGQVTDVVGVAGDGASVLYAPVVRVGPGGIE